MSTAKATRGFPPLTPAKAGVHFGVTPSSEARHL
jgi:hypothetical protein